MAPKIHCVRHAEGFHNLVTPDNHSLPDPLLTEHGKQQCYDLRDSFPYHSQVSQVVASPIKRTIYTALLAFSPVIEQKKLKVIALPELQETSDLPCDTGSDPAEVAREFAGQPVDLSRVEEGWNSKKGRWAPESAAIEARARDARQWLRELAASSGDDDVEIVVVTHGGYLHFLTGDWDGFDQFKGTGWANTEWRTYTIDPSSGTEASFTETSESLARRGRSADAEIANGDSHRDTAANGGTAGTGKKDTASGPAVKDVGVDGVKSSM
ncbi:histidine phosphatase superfamily [Phyllosticta citrichinensis]|uniref:Histidine phosphatase superfamily n=1 Tax=Phyllosticta citrichinensis TaxID=1130410 RepID=A0ABR1Y794_9PEZI